ncbi:MAG: SMI1/KNR4 family protein [Bacteroidota bacterium]
MTRLLEDVRAKVAGTDLPTELSYPGQPTLSPPASDAQIAQAEKTLGFVLPTSLKSLYSSIANGGFGPGYGMIGITGGTPDDTGATCETIYLGWREPDPEDPSWQWPERLLPIAHWGCAIYSCLDCTTPQAPIMVFDPHFLDSDSSPSAFRPHRLSLEDWLHAWLDNVDL